MPTLPYYNAKGERLPGVTWVIGQGLGWNKDALKIWANREGLAGRAITRDFGGTTMTRAADIGTAAHAMIEAEVHLGETDYARTAAELLASLSCDEDREKAQRGFTSFKRWFRQTKISIIATEAYLISEEYQTGGCLDGIGLEEGEDGELELTVVDWKTSKGTYPDHIIQVAAYTCLAEKALMAWLQEIGLPPGQARFAGAYILRVDKETGAFSHKFIPRASLEDAWKVFTWLRAIYAHKRGIEALVR